MRPERRAALALLALLGSASVPSVGMAQGLEQRLRARLEHLPRPIEVVVDGERLYAAQALPEFYEKRVYRPTWVGASGPLPRAGELVEAIRESAREGLRPDDYHLKAIERLLTASTATPATGSSIDLELLSTDAFLLLGAHLVSGRVDPVSFDPEWIAVRREVDLVAALERAASGASCRQELAGLLPDHAGYRALRSALDLYRGLAAEGGWPVVASGPLLRPGDSDSRVPVLRRRLARSDGATSAALDASFYDPALEEAVRRFQALHGLAADGVVGPKTLAALNVPAAERVEQIELNMERWRWLPQELGRRHLLVNIAGFELDAVEGGATRLRLRVAVGRSYRRTPVFSDTIRYLVLNPFWEVPTKLAVQDKLPEIRKDPTYLERLGFEVFQGWGEEQREIDPADVDWDRLGPGRFPYRLRQDPGPLNALGQIKFMFPNRFNVYLHDTPGREIFAQSERDVSSGCIRVERPFELADWLLEGSTRWTPETIRQLLATHRETVVTLEQPVPVHLLYWTTWADEAGEVEFRSDIYGRDARLAQALSTRP